VGMGLDPALFPYYGLVPKPLAENLIYREKVLRACSQSPVHQQLFSLACKRDPLFYINTFGWTYDPRPPEGALVANEAIPFVTYDYQDVLVEKLLRTLGQRDMLVEKSRDVGASWLSLVVMEHKWHFYAMQSFLLVSAKEDLVDRGDDPDCLMWKIDRLHEFLPPWLKVPVLRRSLIIKNELNGSTFTGASTTSDTSRAGRKTAVFFDEFASVPEGHAMLNASRDTTRCRIFVSTPKGINNAFADLRHNSEIEVVTVHWSQHPIKGRDLYRDDTGKKRSPWYDGECKRAAHPLEIRQELDIDYLGSAYQFFDPMSLDAIARETVQPPLMIGELDYLRDSLEPQEFIEADKGRLKLWVMPDADHRMPFDRDYVIGADVATGTGASNSVLSVVDRNTGEKVAEFVCGTNPWPPHHHAEMAIALGRWFKGRYGAALLIWEANGPGATFGGFLLENHYTRIYWRTDERRVGAKPTTVPGWYTTAQNRSGLFGDYRRALEARLFINRSADAVDECKSYVFTPNGEIMHSKAIGGIDPSGARANHGDRVVADALAWRAMKQVAIPRQPEKKIPRSSFGARRDRREARHQRIGVW